MKDLGLPAAPSPFRSASELVNTRLLEIYRTWQELSGTRFAPSRKDIAPARFRTSLSNLFLVDVVDDGADFRLALAGDTVVRFLGSEYRVGKLLSDVTPSPFRERSFRLFQRVIGDKAPVVLGPVRTLHDKHGYFDNEAIVLPLADEEESVTGLLGVIHLSLAKFEAPQAASGGPA